MKKLLLVVLITLSLGFTRCSEPKKAVDNKALEVVTRFNKQCPMMIDSETRIDAIEVKNVNTIIYKYTLVNIHVENIDTATFNAALRPGIINTLKINPDLKELRDVNASFEYYYKDKKNKFIYSFVVTPNDYKTK